MKAIMLALVVMLALLASAGTGACPVLRHACPEAAAARRFQALLPLVSVSRHLYSCPIACVCLRDQRMIVSTRN